MMAGRGGSNLSERRDRDEDSLPVIDADELLLPTAPRRPAGRGLGPARGAALAAGVLVLLVAGIAFGSLGDADPAPSGGSTRPSAPGLAVDATTIPGPCSSQSTLGYPAMELAPLGVPYAVDALFGAAFQVGEEPAGGIAWGMPSLDDALHLPLPQGLALSADLDACLSRLVVTYAATTGFPDDISATLLYDGSFDPGVRGVVLGDIPPGDWVLWVEATFEELDTLASPDRVTVSFFRVVAGNAPFVTDVPAITPEPQPLPTPRVPCGAAEATDDIVVEMSGSTGERVAGIANLVPSAGPEVAPIIPYVPAVLGESLALDIAGATCAVSWEIRLIDPYSGYLYLVSSATNPSEDLTVAAQNHWEIQVLREYLVIASLHFRGGPTVTRTWHVVPASFQMPAAFIVGPDGTRFEASAGCGLTLRLGSGYESADSCETTGYFPGEDALRVAAYAPLRFEIAGWRIVSWSAGCAAMEVDSDIWDDKLGCDLGSAHADDAAGTSLDPVVFLARPGDLVIRVSVTAVGPNGDEFEGSYFARVVAR